MGDAARHYADFPTAEAKALARTLEIGPATGLDKQLRGSMEKTAALALKKSRLLGDANLQPAGSKGGKHSLKISRNRQHQVGFLLLIADKCNLSPLPSGENLR